MIHPIAAGDMYGIDGIDHLTSPGQIKRVIAGSYPSGPSSATPPKIVTPDRGRRDRGLQHPVRASCSSCIAPRPSGSRVS